MCRIPSAALAILATEAARLARQDEILTEIARLEADVHEIEESYNGGNYHHWYDRMRACHVRTFDNLRAATVAMLPFEEWAKQKEAAIHAAMKAEGATQRAECEADCAPLKRQIRRLQNEWIWSF